MTDRFLGDAFGVLSCPFWSSVLQVLLGSRYTPYTTLPCSQRCLFFLSGVCLTVTLHIVDRGSIMYAVSGVVRCTVFMALYLGRM